MTIQIIVLPLHHQQIIALKTNNMTKKEMIHAIASELASTTGKKMDADMFFKLAFMTNEDLQKLCHKIGICK